MRGVEQWALITGASSGLGVEFATQLATSGYSLVLVARNQERLDALATELAERHGIWCEVLVADLHETRGRTLVIDRLTNGDKPISVLVNNAGYGISGDLGESDTGQELNHLTIHVSAPLELTKAVLPQMLNQGFGRVIMVSSVAGYLARGTYSAHKAWGLSFARSVTATYRDRGVVVTAVAPGFTRTEFHQRMNMNVSGVPRFLWLRADRVVRNALKASQAGKAVCVPSLRYKALVAVAAVLPARWHQANL
jgi:short-subunit dehydrogenase